MKKTDLINGISARSYGTCPVIRVSLKSKLINFGIFERHSGMVPEIGLLEEFEGEKDLQLKVEDSH